MRKYLIHMIAGIFMLAVFLPMQVSAEGGELKLDGSGTVTFVSQEAAGEGSTSLAFSLSVEAAEGSTVEFQFGESNAKVAEFRYHEAEGKLNIYMAGTEALIPEDSGSLTVGRVVVLDGSGNNASATVGVVAGSVQYVSGAELKSPGDFKLPDAVQMGTATGGSPGESSSDGDDEDDEDEEAAPGAPQPGNSGQASASSKPGSGGTGSSGRPGGITGGGTVKPGSSAGNGSSGKPGNSAGNGSSSITGSTGENGGSGKPGSATGKEDSSASESVTASGAPDRSPAETGPVIGGETVEKEDGAGTGRMTWIYVVAAVAALLALAVVVLAVIEVRKNRRDSL